MHFRALRTRRGVWQVPVEGPLGEGWPDVFAVNPRLHAAAAFEVKRQVDDEPTPEQAHVHDLLRYGGVPVMVVRPSDLRSPLERSAVAVFIMRRFEKVEW